MQVCKSLHTCINFCVNFYACKFVHIVACISVSLVAFLCIFLVAFSFWLFSTIELNDRYAYIKLRSRENKWTKKKKKRMKRHQCSRLLYCCHHMLIHKLTFKHNYIYFYIYMHIHIRINTCGSAYIKLF